MKFGGGLMSSPAVPVTPFTGVWIEMPHPSCAMSCEMVTPFTGVWIEIESVEIAVPG